MARTFKKRGLRRDLNFADVPTPETALNNMLGGIAQQGQTGDRFISQDLDVIRGLRRTTMTRGDFLNIDNTALKGINPENPEDPYLPIITLQNRFDQARFTIGEPQFYGGDGLTTRYFEPTNVNHATTSLAPSSMDGVVSAANAITFKDEDGNEITSEIFWEQGQYEYLGKIHPDLDTVFGGVEWNGWFKPTSSGRWRWSLGTTGLFTFEFNTGANAVSGPGSVVFSRIRPVISAECTFTNGSATVDVSSATQNGVDVLRHIGRGDIIWSTSYGQLSDVDNLVTVADDVISYTGRTFEMSTAWTGTTVTATVFFAHPFGESSGWAETTGNLSEYEYYPIRIRYIWKDTTYSLISNVSDLNIDNGGEYNFTADSGLINSLSVNVTPPNSSGTYLNYKWLHSENYPRTPTGLDAGDFYNYYENRVPPGGSRITNSDYLTGAIGSNSDADDYENVFTKGQLILPYEPPKTYPDITYTKTMGYEGGSVILTSGNTDGIEVGNLVFPTDPALKSSAAVFVTSISINQAVFLSEPIQGSTSGSETFTFVDHRGLKHVDVSTDWDTSTPGEIRNINTQSAGLEVGDVVINSGVPGSNVNWTTIRGFTSVGTNGTIDLQIGTSSTQLQTSDDPSTAIGAATFIYERAGLKNDSLDTYCNGVYGATTVGTASAGATQITVTNPTIYDGVPGAATLPSSGYYVFFGNRIPAGTTATVSGSTVTLSQAITDDIPADQVLVFVSSNENKDLCFPPTDTSPPFTATVNGLQTTSARPTVEITGNDSEVKFVRLFIENGTVQAAASTDSYTKKIPIKDLNGNTYNLLAVT